MPLTVHTFQGKIKILYEPLHVLKQVGIEECMDIDGIDQKVICAVCCPIGAKTHQRACLLNGLDLLRSRNPIHQFWIGAEWFGQVWRWYSFASLVLLPEQESSKSTTLNDRWFFCYCLLGIGLDSLSI